MVIRSARMILCCVSMLASQVAYSAVAQDEDSSGNYDEDFRAGFRLMAMAGCKAEAARLAGGRVDVTSTCGCAIDSLLESYPMEQLLAAKSPKQRAAMLNPIIQQCVQVSPPSVRE